MGTTDRYPRMDVQHEPFAKGQRTVATHHRRPPMDHAVPDLTHLQFAALATIADGEVSGRNLRARLAEEDIALAGPAFYQFMGRLVKAGLVASRLNEELIRDLAVKETFYSLTNAGRAEFRRTLDFYLARGREVEPKSKSPGNATQLEPNRHQFSVLLISGSRGGP